MGGVVRRLEKGERMSKMDLVGPGGIRWRGNWILRGKGNSAESVNRPGSDSRCKIALWRPHGERAEKWEESPLEFILALTARRILVRPAASCVPVTVAPLMKCGQDSPDLPRAPLTWTSSSVLCADVSSGFLRSPAFYSRFTDTHCEKRQVE